MEGAAGTVNTPLAYSPEDLDAGLPGTIGGKAEGLLRMVRAGASVPPWRVLPAETGAARPWRGDPDVAVTLSACFDALVSPPFSGLAVRSSADVEDQPGAAHAGLFDTVFITRSEDLEDAVERVLDSVRSPEAEAYQGEVLRSAKYRRLSSRSESGRRDALVGKTAVRAEGEPAMAVVLQAAVDAQYAGVLFSADPAAAWLDEAYIEAVWGRGEGLVDGSRAPSRFFVALDGGAVRRSAPGDDGPECLPEEHIRDLVHWLLVLEEASGAALDIEWAVDETRLWLLQARPITALHADSSLRPSVPATSWFFDQRFYEPIHPITRTSLLPLIVRVGIEEALEMRGRKVEPPLLYFYGGQAYVRHDAYRGMLSGVPWWWLSEDLRQLFLPGVGKRPTRGLGSTLHYAWCSFWSVLKHRRDVIGNISVWRQFCANLPSALADIPKCSGEDPEVWQQAWSALDDLTGRLLQIHRWSLLWAGYAYRLFQLLLAFAPRAVRERITARFQASLQLVTFEANRALGDVLAHPDDAKPRTYLASQFGHRSGSLDYAMPTWAELAEEGALGSAFGHLALRETEVPVTAGRRWVDRLLGPVRELVEMREEQRFEWERILARQRAMLLRAGKLLRARGLLGAEKDVWFLEWHELISLLEGSTAFSPQTLALRRHARRVERLIEKPAFVGLEPVEEPQCGGTARGIPASAGCAEGRAVVLRRPADLACLEGEDPVIAVLVSLDPAWTPLLTKAVGVVLERGGVLSHAAILAREYRVPMVIGVPEATKRFPEGVMLRVDGKMGTVTISS